ncbi:MAG: ABC transporter ATPase [Bacteroidota bacterium]
MNLSAFPPDTRVWVYQADRLLTATEKTWLQEQIDTFTDQWASHGNQLTAQGFVYNDFTIVLGVDTSQANSSGCSIDKSVHFIKEAGKALQVDFFNRLKVWIKHPGREPERIPFKSLADHPDALYYNGMVQTLAGLNSKYEIKASDILQQIN